MNVKFIEWIRSAPCELAAVLFNADKRELARGDAYAAVGSPNEDDLVHFRPHEEYIHERLQSAKYLQVQGAELQPIRICKLCDCSATPLHYHIG